MLTKPTYEELEEQVQELIKVELELQRTEELLKDEITRRRLLVDQSRDGIVVLDQNGSVYEAIKRFADMLGYTMEEVSRLFVWDWDFIYTKEQILEMIRAIDDSGAHFETQHRRKDGTILDIELSNNGCVYRGQKLVFCICRDITERKRAEKEHVQLIKKLQDALAEIKTLRGILPICSYCNRIRNEQGEWEKIEMYVRDHTDAEFSHGLCPECARKRYPKYFDED